MYEIKFKETTRSQTFKDKARTHTINKNARTPPIQGMYV